MRKIKKQNVAIGPPKVIAAHYPVKHDDRDPKERFQRVLKELMVLRDEQVISDEQLENLIIYACGFLVEHQVERRINIILNKAVSIERIVKVLG